ncbi:hypothetical protein PI124_g11611 [Phytophthora idaei]|nr:hypothetical protein PI125_g468 [Phytophthora idaei]KAG3165895.1 hypothetical protein PI126_g4400 [Phytophthora idaei]KAG3243576.1 hypothetical protein PI124_g11611 [Phytophthora idaei]
MNKDSDKHLAMDPLGASSSLRSVGTGDQNRFLRSHKTNEDDSGANNVVKEERGGTLQAPADIIARWLNKGKAPNMVKQKLRITDFTPEYSAMKKLYNDSIPEKRTAL